MRDRKGLKGKRIRGKARDRSKVCIVNRNSK